jgi:HPt (histidine-containing phosphotransfer) domain-containing protein
MLTKYIGIKGNNDTDTDIVDDEDEPEMNQEQYINLNMLHEQIGDDEDFKEVFLNLLIQELTRAEKNIEKAAQEKDIAETRMILHKLKGTAGSAGLFKIAECALKWEKATEEGMDFYTMSNEINQDIKIGLDIIKDLMK